MGCMCVICLCGQCFYLFELCHHVVACSCFWPQYAHFLFNTYRKWLVLVFRGSSTYLYNKESVTQGDPLSVIIYAIGSLPLIHSISDPGQWAQLLYADDASASEILLQR